MEEAVVRDLRGGLWSRQVLEGSNGVWEPAAKELLKKLRNKVRLLAAQSEEEQDPQTPLEWGKEALQSHAREPLSAVVVGNRVFESLAGNPVVCCVERLPSSQWWRSRSCSVRLGRQMDDYLRVLRLVLGHAIYLRFIDPHLDPSQRRYSQFKQLMFACKRTGLLPRIELHRVGYKGSGRDKDPFKTVAAAKELFQGLDRAMAEEGIEAEVFVWDDFHDRHLITNLLGISMANGFDTSGNSQERTTWTRLSFDDRVDVEREFDLSSKKHDLHFKFTIGSRP
jgi:hypothetical protein